MEEETVTISRYLYDRLEMDSVLLEATCRLAYDRFGDDWSDFIKTVKVDD